MAASPSGILDDIKELNTCQICMNNFDQRDPRGLSCFHVFCFECIQKLVEEGDQQVQCPVCSHDTPLADDSVNDLPQHTQASKLQDICNKYMKTDKVKVRCKICGFTTVTAYCFTCTQTLCQSCQEAHEASKRYRIHTKVKVTQDTLLSLLCIKHDQLYESYCTQCMEAVCRRCQVTSHAQHVIEDFCVDHTTTDHPEQTDRDFLVKKLEDVEQMQRELKDHIQSIYEDILCQKSMLIKQIEDQVKKLHKEVNKYQTDTNGYLQNMQTQLKIAIDTLDANTIICEKLTMPLPNFPELTLNDLKNYLGTYQEPVHKENWTIFKQKQYGFVKRTEQVAIGYLAQLKGQTPDNIPDSIASSSS